MATSNRKPHRKIGRKSSPVAKRSTRPAVKILSSDTPKKSAPLKTPKEAVSKQDKVLEMLRAPSGTTIAAIMKATDWQQHSVRGFLAGTVRKKLKQNLTSVKTDGQRVYRIAKAGTAK